MGSCICPNPGLPQSNSSLADWVYETSPVNKANFNLDKAHKEARFLTEQM
ncbi:MAG: hypothetical protein BTN85_1357 [Candidatus Methanohalarchaeum thermophilum]|uniref:Uncharacterized protein n=1 Tax=Methanohalarchaeum thermophilum TaxID=1903181 RepID=A0A1Q6DWU8_METT1|nr:MAG: hypothetical protein BTN85_1357 [Candidatus Methanohalarchaeum thermophilum]